MAERHESEVLDAFLDALAQDLETPAPGPMARGDADVARSIVALERAVPGPGAEVATRIWARVLEDVEGAHRPVSTAQSTYPWSAFRPKGRVRLLDPAPWMAPAAAVLLIVLLGAAAIGLSPEAQAQARRLACLVPGLGVRACDSTGLVSMQAVFATGNGRSAQVLGFQASSQGTLVRMRLSGLPLPGPNDVGQDQRFENALPLIRQIQTLQVEVRDSRGQVLTPVAPGGDGWPGTPRTGARYARILYFWMEPALDGTWRVSVTAEWAFSSLDPDIRLVDISVPAPAGPLSLAIPLVQVQTAGLPVLGGEGARVTQHEVTLWVAGIADSSSGLTVQIAGQAASAGEHVVGVGIIEPGQQTPVLGRILSDSLGHQYAEVNPGSADRTSDGDGFLQTLTFPSLPAGARPATLEVPSVFVLQDSAVASVTVTIDALQTGEHLALNTHLAFGRYPLLVQGATILTTPDGRELVVDLDQGDVQDGRALLGARTVQVSGRDDLHLHVTGDDPTGHHRQVHVPLPPDIGPQVTMTFSGAFVEVRGPWRLEVPGGPGYQP